MIYSFIVSFIIASLLGFFSGLGVGGGNLMMLWLTEYAKFTSESAKEINLIFFLASAISATVFRFRSMRIPVLKLLAAAACGCISALVLSMVSTHLDFNILRKCFGGLLVFCGVRELYVFYKACRCGKYKDMRQ